MAGLGADRAIWRNVLLDLGNSWRAHWQAVPDGNYSSAPILTLSTDGTTLQLLALGNDFRLCFDQSKDGGAHWSGAHALTSEGFV